MSTQLLCRTTESRVGLHLREKQAVCVYSSAASLPSNCLLQWDAAHLAVQDESEQSRLGPRH